MEPVNVGSPNPNTSGCGCDACPCTIIKITEDESQSYRRPSKKPRIPKVPKALRDIEDHDKCFDPVVLSIGPYHHGKPELEMVQNLKIACARQFVSGCDLNNFCSMVEDVATKAWAYYDWSMIGQGFDDKEFTRMMFLDGCFILHFIDCCINETDSELYKHINIPSLIWRDLFLLENQLPYVVLKAFMSFKYTEAQWQEMFDEFINFMVNPQDFSSSEDGAGSYDQQQPLLHQSIGDGGDDQQQPLHLLALLWTKLVGSRDDAQTSSQSSSEILKSRSYPSINELIAVGINIKRSKTSCLNDIHFRHTMFGGELLLPQIVIDDYTREKFLNLVAYERSIDTDGFPVSSYLYFMDTLIHDANDVKNLRSKQILFNRLGTNEQVADHFNKLAVGLVPDANAYSRVMMGIDKYKYYKSNIRVFIEEILHSPIATFAAIITIYLTILQTLFSVLSYLKGM